MRPPRVVIVDTGSANLASVSAAVRRAGATPIVSSEPGEIADAERLILPGVGNFGAVMTTLSASGAAAVLRERVERGRSLLAICLGLQLLAEGSDEAPGIPGLGLIGVRARVLPRAPRLPQLGWNLVRAGSGTLCGSSGHAYFANSFALTEAPGGWTASWSDYGAPFIAALERETQLACQFHPELSGTWGAELMSRWIARC